MSIAVRVSVWILGMLVVVSAAVAVMALMQKQTLQGQNQALHNQLTDAQSHITELTSKAKTLQDQSDELNAKITQAQQDKSQLQSQFDELKTKTDDLQHQVEQAGSDRDDWKNRVETISRERDDLMQKLKNQPTKIVYKTKIVHDAANDASATAATGTAPSTAAAGNDEYWASVLKQKAALQIELQKEKVELDQAALQVVSLKKQNSDLELQVKQISNDKDDIVQKIKYGQDLADNLSIDLARARNDQQSVTDRAEKVRQQNMQLLSQIRDLNSTKLELERTVSRLTDEKDGMQKKLVETESVIQSRIDDIWKIKSSLDKRLAENAPASSGQGSMDLPPIIVNAPNQPQAQAAPAEAQPQAAPAADTSVATSSGKTQGTIISINESNNFVIVDFGKDNSPVSIGTPLEVYRNGQNVALLDVIQVRRDICAADIKDKSAQLKVGDTVRFRG